MMFGNTWVRMFVDHAEVEQALMRVQQRYRPGRSLSVRRGCAVTYEPYKSLVVTRPVPHPATMLGGLVAAALHAPT